MKQRTINLNPDPQRMEAIKITRKRGFWRIEAMRFIPHSGEARR